MKIVLYDNLVKFHQEILQKVGLDDFSNNSVTTGLCETSLRGVDSHGVRLLPHYVNSALHGRKNPKPVFNFNKTFPAIGHLDADNAFGHAAGMIAIDYCMDMAEQAGVGIVAVSNSSHPGAMASMALKAARKGYMAFAFTHADSLVLSYNGKRPYFGTNPVCFAAPRVDKDPYCLDMATSITPWNRILVHKNENKPLPEGIAVDHDGIPTTDPDAAAAVMPTGEYKGYGLASMVEILCGIYTGMDFGRSIPSMYKAPIDQPRRLGQFYMVIRTDGAISKDFFMERMQEMTKQVRLEPGMNGESVILPGDKEIYEADKRMLNGIPIDNVTEDSFEALSKKYNVPINIINSDN